MGAKSQTERAPPSSPGMVSTGAGVGELETTSQCEGAVTVKREGGLEVGLFEDGEHPPRVGDLELGVQVDLVVHRVHEAVQALAGVHVGRVRDDQELVVRGQVRQLDPDAVGDLGRVQFAAVERHAVHRVGDGVDEGRGSRRAAVNFTVVVEPKTSAPRVRSRLTS